MTENRLSALIYLLIALACVNLGISAYLVLRPGNVTNAQPKESAKTFPEAKVNALAQRTISLYNQKKTSELYAIFDGVARMQFAERNLSAQVEKLHSLVGTVGDYAYSYAQFAGTQDTKPFYNLLYKVRLEGSSFNTGELKLVVYEKDDGLALVGFFLYGQDDGRSIR
jgi:hypothetical protein